MAPGYVSNKKSYYSCGAKRNKNMTTKPHDENITVRNGELDQKVWAGLTNLLYDPNNLKKQLISKVERKQEPRQLDQTKLGQIEKEIGKLTLQESRIIDAYREGVIDLEELKDQKEKINERLDVLESKKKAALSYVEGPGQAEIPKSMLDDLSVRYQRVMANADFETKSKIANLLINRVFLHQEKAVVEGNIPVEDIDALTKSPVKVSFSFP